MYASFQNNGTEWRCSFLGEEALLIEADPEQGLLNKVHRLVTRIESANLAGVTEVVPAYASLAVLFRKEATGHKKLIQAIEELNTSESEDRQVVHHSVPVCYDLGLDWETLTEHTGLTKSEVIDIHTSKEYTVAMLGFVPGFVFLEGLDEKIACPRKEIPRKKIPEGAVGIGGKQTGIYSLESPGGWNILGITPVSFFHVNEAPPVPLKAGDTLSFYPISKEEYKREKGNG